MILPATTDCRTEFDLWMFSHDCGYASAAMAAGMVGVVVDWEWRDKELRQAGRDTEINHATEEDLRLMRMAVRGAVACRINNQPHVRVQEARRAAELGADEVWLPMVRSVTEVEECLAVLPPGCRLGLLAETPEAMGLATQFSRLPLSRVYVGLNDLWISSGRPHLFSALIDRVVERFREEYTGALGVAGVTRPASGSPVPCRLLLAEMSRLSCRFGVARRAFRRDAGETNLLAAIGEIHAAMHQLSRRSRAQITEDRRALEILVRQLEFRRAELADRAES